MCECRIPLDHLVAHRLRCGSGVCVLVEDVVLGPGLFYTATQVAQWKPLMPKCGNVNLSK